MARVLTRAQALQNRAFLKSLARTGNVRLAAREVGAKYGTMQHRRRAHPAFAMRWDAALAFAQAHINAKGREPPKAKRGNPRPLRTAGGEMVICRRNDGKLQMRRAQPAYAAMRAGLPRRAERDRQRHSVRSGGGRIPARFLSPQAAMPGLRAGAAAGARPRLPGAGDGAARRRGCGQPRAWRLAPQRPAADPADEREAGVAADAFAPEGGADARRA